MNKKLIFLSLFAHTFAGLEEVRNLMDTYVPFKGAVLWTGWLSTMMSEEREYKASHLYATCIGLLPAFILNSDATIDTLPKLKEKFDELTQSYLQDAQKEVALSLNAEELKRLQHLQSKPKEIRGIYIELALKSIKDRVKSLAEMVEKDIDSVELLKDLLPNMKDANVEENLNKDVILWRRVQNFGKYISYIKMNLDDAKESINEKFIRSFKKNADEIFGLKLGKFFELESTSRSYFTDEGRMYGLRLAHLEASLVDYLRGDRRFVYQYHGGADTNYDLSARRSELYSARLDQDYRPAPVNREREIHHESLKGIAAYDTVRASAYDMESGNRQNQTLAEVSVIEKAEELPKNVTRISESNKSANLKENAPTAAEVIDVIDHAIAASDDPVLVEEKKSDRVATALVEEEVINEKAKVLVEKDLAEEEAHKDITKPVEEELIQRVFEALVEQEDADRNASALAEEDAAHRNAQVQVEKETENEVVSVSVTEEVTHADVQLLIEERVATAPAQEAEELMPNVSAIDGQMVRSAQRAEVDSTDAFPIAYLQEFLLLQNRSNAQQVGEYYLARNMWNFLPPAFPREGDSSRVVELESDASTITNQNQRKDLEQIEQEDADQRKFEVLVEQEELYRNVMTRIEGEIFEEEIVNKIVPASVAEEDSNKDVQLLIEERADTAPVEEAEELMHNSEIDKQIGRSAPVVHFTKNEEPVDEDRVEDSHEDAHMWNLLTSTSPSRVVDLSGEVEVESDASSMHNQNQDKDLEQTAQENEANRNTLLSAQMQRLVADSERLGSAFTLSSMLDSEDEPDMPIKKMAENLQNDDAKSEKLEEKDQESMQEVVAEVAEALEESQEVEPAAAQEKQEESSVVAEVSEEKSQEVEQPAAQEKQEESLVVAEVSEEKSQEVEPAVAQEKQEESSVVAEVSEEKSQEVEPAAAQEKQEDLSVAVQENNTEFDAEKSEKLEEKDQELTQEVVAEVAVQEKQEELAVAAESLEVTPEVVEQTIVEEKQEESVLPLQPQPAQTLVLAEEGKEEGKESSFSSSESADESVQNSHGRNARKKSPLTRQAKVPAAKSAGKKTQGKKTQK